MDGEVGVWVQGDVRQKVEGGGRGGSSCNALDLFRQLFYSIASSHASVAYREIRICKKNGS